MNNAERICGVTPEAARIKTTLNGWVICIASLGSFKNRKYWDAKNVLKEFEEVFGGGMHILSIDMNCDFFYWQNQTDSTCKQGHTPLSHHGFRGLKKLNLWQCEVQRWLRGFTDKKERFQRSEMLLRSVTQ